MTRIPAYQLLTRDDQARAFGLLCGGVGGGLHRLRGRGDGSERRQVVGAWPYRLRGAGRGGLRGGDAELYVDRAPCDYCVTSMAGLARSIGLNSLRVWTPDGLFGTYDIYTGKFVLEP